ncbi:hypothetical protein CEN41_08260 [Fischerella thermalis CCMEE 5330]|uniref:Uncharacterized protein n=1 Tax=Fischerella thermalis CCMEE 5330 TaxID=2019670 RepID=A0A2N6MFA5_9CYAN|nr:hypothetical protein CEN41_08260 [Fischerella thermalis CCMEE 5330]
MRARKWLKISFSAPKTADVGVGLWCGWIYATLINPVENKPAQVGGFCLYSPSLLRAIYRSRVLIKTYNISVYIEKSQENFLRFKIIEKYQQMKI